MATAFTAIDHAMMARALRLAERGAFTTKPNPMVGCVIAKDGEILGEGWHQRAGGPHAEVFALLAAGDAARGAPVRARHPINTARRPQAAQAVGAEGFQGPRPCRLVVRASGHAEGAADGIGR